jgi:hypothetical protein
MTDTTILPTVPAYVQVDRGDHQNHHHGLTEKDALSLAVRSLVDNVNAVTVAVTANGAANSLATEKTGAANELATNVQGLAGQLATEKTAAAIQLANSLAFSNTQNLLISGFKDGRYDASVNAAATALASATNTAAIQLTSAQNTAAIQAAAAECCCEIKTLVISDGQKTRDLINQLQDLNKAVELVDAKQEITLLKMKNVAITS